MKITSTNNNSCNFKAIYFENYNSKYYNTIKKRFQFMKPLLIGWDGRIRTSEMAGPKPAALPLGDVPSQLLYYNIKI